MAVSSKPTLKIEPRPISSLKAAERNARTHPRKQIRQIAASIERFGFTCPVLIDDDGVIIAGHGRVAAAKLLNLDQVPTLRLSNLSADERRAYALADNKLALNAGWDVDFLALELKELSNLSVDLDLTGFSVAEVDELILNYQNASPDADEEEDRAVDLRTVAVSRPGDVWQVGRHRLACGDATKRETYASLFGDEEVGLIFADPPYNLPIVTFVEGTGRKGHRAFSMANGELAPGQFRSFLEKCFGHAAERARAGSIAYACIDWRHMAEMQGAGLATFSELKNLIVWKKTNAGMGNFYRSQHELIFAFKVKPGRHINNFNLGENGRHRTNVWDYAGVASFGGNGNRRLKDLALHPTVKPVALVADAIRDTSRRGDIILDMFGGVGTTMIAAEKTGRCARLIEIDPLYCDASIDRFTALLGILPTLVATGQTFEEVSAERTEA